MSYEVCVCEFVVLIRIMHIHGEASNYQTPWRQMAKLSYYAVFAIKVPMTKHEIMLNSVMLNLPTLLTAFTV